ELYFDTNGDGQFSFGERLTRGNSSNAGDFQVSRALTAGTYHLRIRPLRTTDVTAYNMALSLSSGGAMAAFAVRDGDSSASRLYQQVADHVFAAADDSEWLWRD
ncbi:MAG: hypothetical protein KDA55_00645, partial [Planctomycetales bacterium]|nr:hypothetical protein [Planctomycetales bacterium]